MRNLIDKRDELYYKYSGLSTLKFSPEARKNSININQQIEEIQKKYLFFRNYIKIGGKLNGELLRSKKR